MSANPWAAAAEIEPFWNRLPQITRYPLGMAAMVPIIVLALAHLLGYLPLGFLWVLLVTVAMYRYAFDCLLASADGQLEPPDAMGSDSGNLGWKLIGLMLLFLVLALGLATLAGPRLGLLVLLLFGLALPGAIITLAMEDSVLLALNPARWLGLATRIGWPYLAAVGLCLVVFASQRYAAAMVASFLPTVLAVIVVAMFSNYALVVTFHLMGYLVYQYHEELGVESAGPQGHGPLGAPDPDQEVLDESAALVREGNLEGATECLRVHLRRGGTAAVHKRFRKLLEVGGDKDGLLRHGHEYLNILMAQDQDRAALDLLRECQAIDPAFEPAEARQVTRLAHLAAQTGQAQLALRLLSGFHKRFPKSPEVPANLLLAATLMHERLGQDDKAQRILRALQKNFPHSPLMPEIEQRLDAVDKMLAATGKRQSRG